MTYGFGVYLFPTIASEMKRDLEMSFTTIGVITALSQAGFLSAASLSGFLVKKFGDGRVILGSVFISSLGLIALYQIENIALLSIVFLILGGCTATVWTPMVGVIGRHISYENRGKALGLIASGTNYGVFLNGAIVPLLLSQYGWRSIWLSVGVLALSISLLSAYLMVKANMLDTKNNQQQADVISYRRVLAAKPYLIWLVMFLGGLTCMPFFNYIALFLQTDMNASVETTGVIWMIIGFMGMIGGVVVGWMGDRIGVRFSLGAMLLLVSSAACLLVLNPFSVAIYLAATGFGFAFNGIFGLVPTYISKLFSPNLGTGIFAGANLMLGLGSMLGNFIVGWSKSEYGSFAYAYTAIALVTAIIALLCMALRSEDRDRELAMAL